MDNVNEVLREYARVLEEALVDGIISEGLLKTGELGKSVRVSFDENNSEFSISMKDYGFYQDSGVSGIRERVPSNPESLFDPGQFRSKVIGGPLPFPVKKSIAQKGFRPRPFINTAVSRTTEQLTEPLTEAGAIDVDEMVLDIFKTNGAKV
jgi:hypothetical protein